MLWLLLPLLLVIVFIISMTVVLFYWRSKRANERLSTSRKYNFLLRQHSAFWDDGITLLVIFHVNTVCYISLPEAMYHMLLAQPHPPPGIKYLYLIWPVPIISSFKWLLTLSISRIHQLFNFHPSIPSYQLNVLLIQVLMSGM